jgi:hypothetical protein
VYDGEIEKEKIEHELSILKENENDNVKFDFVYRKSPDAVLNRLSHNSWMNLFKKYNIH